MTQKFTENVIGGASRPALFPSSSKSKSPKYPTKALKITVQHSDRLNRINSLSQNNRTETTQNPTESVLNGTIFVNMRT
jgi:hypothetical protein